MNAGISILFFVTVLLLQACDSDNEKSKCGCESDVVTAIPESANLVGEIGYKIQLDPNDNYYNNAFWIGYTEPDCGNCIHHMIVCNEDMLGDFQYLKNNPYDRVQVKFSGKLKELCEKNFHPADETFDHIVLIKIERQ